MQMTMDVMSVQQEDIIDGVEFGGAATVAGRRGRFADQFFL
jgi:peroxiredoxin family protein